MFFFNENWDVIFNITRRNLLKYRGRKIILKIYKYQVAIIKYDGEETKEKGKQKT